MSTATDTVTIRPALPSDRAALARLAALDSTRPLTGAVLIAEVGAEPQAAIAVADARTIADPFRPTAELVELLGRRVAAMRRAEHRPRPRLCARGLKWATP